MQIVISSPAEMWVGSAWSLERAMRHFSTNSRAFSHDRAMLVRGSSWTNVTASPFGVYTNFSDRRSSTGKLPAMSERRYLSSREVHFLSAHPTIVHARAPEPLLVP